MKVLLQAFLSVYLISVALADTCRIDASDREVSSQDELDERFAACTTILGPLRIAYNYTGSLILHNITNITGGISTIDNHGETVNLTSIQADDLVSLSDLTISDVPALKKALFLKLETIGFLKVNVSSDDVEISFPSLSNAGVIEIGGPISRMDFSSLSTVMNGVSVSSNNTINQYNTYSDTGLSESYPPLDIDFPALQNCSQLFLFGNISSISMPSLESTIQTRYSTRRGITISTYGNPLNVKLPKLWNVTEISMYGTIGSFSFPSLITLNGGLWLIGYYPINYDLAPLQSATILGIGGNVTAIAMSSLKNLEQISVDSNRGLDCEIVAHDWARIHNIPLITDPDEQVKNNNWKGFRCRSALTYENPHSTQARKLEFGLGIGLGVPVIFVLAFFIYRKRARAKKRAAKPPPYEHELDDHHDHHDHHEAPPAYEPRHVSESNDAVSDVSSFSDVGEGQVHHGSAPPSLFEDVGSNEQGQGHVRTAHEAHS